MPVLPVSVMASISKETPLPSRAADSLREVATRTCGAAIPG